MKSQKKNKQRNLFLRIFDFKYWFYDFVKITGAISVIIYLRIKKYYLSGKKKKNLFKGPLIIVSNHTSFIDPIIVSSAVWQRRVSFIATKNLFEQKFWKIFFTGIRCIPVNKENVEMKTFKMARETINRGHTVAIFPEGHVQRADGIDGFKSGAVMFAVLCKAPILQIYIEKRKHWWNRQRVIIGNKIDVESLLSSSYPSMDEIQKITEMLYQQEIELSNVIKDKMTKK